MMISFPRVLRLGAYYSRPLLLLTASALCSSVRADPRDYFRVSVVDADTGRGVPLVELRTTNDVRYFTDSNGIVAINDPEFLGQKVYFFVQSHGYQFPKDGFGYSGLALRVVAGGQGRIEIKRQNIAERLYRITGAGIYRDSVLAGVAVPLKQPLLDGLVMGQDTVEAVPYKGRLFWLWGDTNRPAFPLGNFKTSSATSLLPGRGGLDPSVGVDLNYFVDAEGFSKESIALPSTSPVWMGALFTLPDERGQERLFGSYAKAQSDSKFSERGLAVWNDDKAIFEKVRAFDSTLVPEGKPFKARSGGQTFLYFDPFQRTLADYAHAVDGRKYQAFTPLVAGTAFDGANTRLERGADGQLVYSWKTDTGKLGVGDIEKLVQAGQMKAQESPFQFRDIETDAPVVPHGTSTYWNPFRRRWVQIFTQASGSSSYLGEQWFAEADTPTGPWVYCRKIVTHDKYTFYNPVQHPFFAQQEGRLIYFEGTYTATYSGQELHTPRYDYNQIMYRLALDDSRLSLPVPVYLLKSGGYALGDEVEAQAGSPRIERIPFFALPLLAKPAGTIPIYALGDHLQTQAALGAKPIFRAFPATATEADFKSPAVAPLYEYVRAGKRFYSTNANETGAGVVRTQEPLCRVWRNPSSVLALDWGVHSLEQ